MRFCSWLHGLFVTDPTNLQDDYAESTSKLFTSHGVSIGPIKLPSGDWVKSCFGRKITKLDRVITDVTYKIFWESIIVVDAKVCLPAANMFGSTVSYNASHDHCFTTLGYADRCVVNSILTDAINNLLSHEHKNSHRNFLFIACSWECQPPSQKQIEYAMDLGVKLNGDETKKTASELIELALRDRCKVKPAACPPVNLNSVNELADFANRKIVS